MRIVANKAVLCILFCAICCVAVDFKRLGWLAPPHRQPLEALVSRFYNNIYIPSFLSPKVHHALIPTLRVIIMAIPTFDSEDTFVIVSASLEGILIKPLFIIWVVSFCKVRERRQDPARRPFTWMKIAYPFILMSVYL
jgi:hypothetical protein